MTPNHPLANPECCDCDLCRNARTYEATTPPRPLSAVHKVVQDYAERVFAQNQEITRLRRRVSNQRRELRRLCHAQSLLRQGERMGKSSVSSFDPNATRRQGTGR